MGRDWPCVWLSISLGRRWLHMARVVWRFRSLALFSALMALGAAPAAYAVCPPIGGVYAYAPLLSGYVTSQDNGFPDEFLPAVPADGTGVVPRLELEIQFEVDAAGTCIAYERQQREGIDPKQLTLRRRTLLDGKFHIRPEQDNYGTYDSNSRGRGTLVHGAYVRERSWTKPLSVEFLSEVYRGSAQPVEIASGSLVLDAKDQLIELTTTEDRKSGTVTIRRQVFVRSRPAR